MTAVDWRLVPGFPDYWVSSVGVVVSVRGVSPREIRGADNGKGYRIYHLRTADGQIRVRAAHRLVALAFLGTPPEGMQVRHLDGNKSNNQVDNLTYGTASDNMHDQVRHGDHANARKTHCPRGHAYDEANTYVIPSTGSRACRACRAAFVATRSAA